MGFLSPAFLVAGLLGAIPVLLHLFARRRAMLVDFAPVELVARAEARVRKRLKIRDALLLAIRVLSVLALAVALSRPFAVVEATGVSGLAGPEALVVVLDDSMSLGASDAFARARRASLDTIAALGVGDAAALVLASRPIRQRPRRVTFELGAVERAIDETRVTLGRADIAEAIRTARRLVGASSLPNKRIVVVTDLQKTSWPSPIAAAVEDVPLRVIDVGRAVANLSVLSVDVEPASDLGEGIIRVTTEVANGSRSPRRVPVSLRLGGEILARGNVDVPAGGTARKVFHHRTSDAAQQEGEVSIAEDDLPFDDRRPFLFGGSRALRVLLVDGDPRPANRDDEVFYLVRALSPGGAADIVPTVVDVAGLSGRRLSDFGAVVLCNVGSLPRVDAAALEAYVRSGGGVLFAGGDRVRPIVWNRTFEALLPAPISGVERAPSGLESTGLEVPDARHPLLAVFGLGAPGLVGGSFRRYLTLASGQGEPPVEILRLTSGAPLLVERTIGTGRVLLWTSTLDRDWTDLPLRTGYLPLVQQAVRHLAHRASSHATVRRVGDEVALPVPPDTARVVVRGPDGARRTLDVVGRTARFPRTDCVGVHRVETEGKSGGLREDPSLAFVVTIDPAESDLRRHPRGPKGVSVAATGAAASHRRLPLWPLVLGLLLPLAIAEAVMRAWKPRGGSA